MGPVPRPAMRSSYIIKKRVRTPGGTLVIHYERRDHGKPRCGRCGRPLNGVAFGRPPRIRRLAKTRKRPNRYFGGTLCPSCLAYLIKQQVRIGV